MTMCRARIEERRITDIPSRRRELGPILGIAMMVTFAVDGGAHRGGAAAFGDPGNVGQGRSGWIGVYAREARGVPFTEDDWSGLVCTLQFSGLQTEAADQRLAGFLAAEVHAQGVGSDLDPSMTELHRDFPEARGRLAASIRRHRAAWESEIRTFFAKLRDDVVAEDQQPTLDIVERAALRRVALSTIAPAYMRLEGDPDWVFLRERCRRDGVTGGIAVLADHALIVWREEADRLARKIAEASDAFMAHDASPWGDGIMSGDAGMDDFKPEESLGRRLMALQDEWVRHRRAFPRVLDGLVDEQVLVRVMDEVLYGACDHRTWIPAVDVRPSIAELLVHADVAEDERAAASARATAALIEQRSAAAAAARDAVCDAWRAYYAAHTTNIPLLGTVSETYRAAYREAGEQWAANWRRTLEELRESGVRGELEGSVAAAAWDELVESIESTLEAWDRWAEKYL